jgi:hypothetical protein
LISTKAGFVNRTEGRVEIERYGNADEERGRASTGTQMRNGDHLMTLTDGYAEVLLNPGTYLRLRPQTQIRALQTSLAKVQFELLQGSIIVEAGEVDKNTPLEIRTPHGPLTIRRDGLHRIDAQPRGTRVAVRQGDLWIGTPEEVLRKEGVRIGRGKETLLNGSNPTPQLAKIDKDRADEFDIWSFSRAQTLVAANNMALRESRGLNTLAHGWFFNPFTGGYTFIPRNGLFYSPYGFGFFNSFATCFTCFGNVYRGLGWGIGAPNNNRPGGGLQAPARVITGADRTPIQRQVEGRRAELGGGIDAMNGGFGGGRAMGGRSIGMPSAAPTVIAAPMPSRSGGMGGGSAAPAGGGGGRPAGPSRP